MTTIAEQPAVTSRSAVDLAQAIRRRELTSEEVVGAHIERLRRSAPKLNAVAADRYAAALQQARRIDADIANSSMRGVARDRPPLLGVPFTVKESIAVKGMPHSAGVVARRELRAQQSAIAIARLQTAGAIPIAVTNTSELTLWIESENRLYGRTNNPYDPSRTAGGSSGGEAAAIAVGGSPFGIAADIGGSIRIPALFCGVFGHKPSSGLVPNTGVWPGATGDAAVMLSTGPLARRAEDLLPLLEVIAGPDGRDPSATGFELGTTAEVTLVGLQVTTIEEIGPLGRLAGYSHALLEARERAVGALAAAGAIVRQVTLPNRYRSVLPFLTALTEGSRGTVDALLDEAGERPIGTRALLLGDGRHTVPTRLAVALDRLGGLLGAGRRSKQLALASDLAREISEAVGNGVLLHPAFPTLAPRHRLTYGQPWLMMPSAIFNLAGLPVTEVPLGLDPETGLPVGVQVVAPYGEDHLAIAMAIELEAVFGGWRPPPGL